ncbi:MAG TPA: glycoside hydrolase family 2 TIM barrel-domain containing protein, partial [Armatimonadota bacterium]|nr:glycoside hydrolase family 2 TIM barrel-domain containing protein [Armatimonadota bacterium]
GGYTPFSFDITDALKEGPQEVVVAVYDPADPRRGAYQPKGKQLGSEGIWYTRTTGIWQTVWLEPVHPAGLEVAWSEARVDPATRRGEVTVHFRTESASPADVELVLSQDGREVAGGLRTAAAGERDGAVSLQMENCRLWSPEEPVLYDLTVRAKQGGKTVDEVKSYCAFRSYGIRNGRLELNGKPYFLRGVLDQGYWPDGILTPPTDRAIRADVEMTKRLGFNFARKHVKVEDPRWYYWCDRLGLAVWQDMPSSHNLSTAQAQENFAREWTGVIQDVRSHPSVLHWIPFNENWGDPKEFQDRIVQLTRRLDPSRPITDASGWTQRSFTDVIDVHDYGNNLIRHAVQNPSKPKVIGEYGGIALPVPGHTWTQGWGYQTVRDPDGLIRRIGAQTTQLFEAANLSGFVYTQLTDVEQELNGLMTYDRIPKTDPKRFAEVFEGRRRFEPRLGGYIQSWRVLGPLPSGTGLRSSQDSPESHAAMEQMLAKPFLADEALPDTSQPARVNGQALPWRAARAATDALDFHQVFGRETNNAVAYAVARFELPRGIEDASLLFGSDDSAKVWLNGKLVHTVVRIRGVNLDEDEIRGLTLKPGPNVLVVKVAQGVGGWGVAARFQKPDGTILKLDGAAVTRSGPAPAGRAAAVR